MIHVLNFKDEIIDFISQNDDHIIQANHKRNINDRSETFDFTILSKRTEHLKERNRIIIQDSNKQYREFIIEHISSDIDGYTTVETSASYLQDIATAKPLAPMKLEKMTTMQALKEVLKDTGWEASDETEYGGTRTTSWTSYNTKYEVLLQLCTTYDMMLDFYIELDSNTVKHRYVTLKKRNALFKGKEIVYGKDLTGLKRTVDLSSIKTALLCISPEDDKGQRIVLEVHDDEAQERFGLPKRYIWDVYEPESSDDKMTEDRLRTLGTTELNKRKVEIISYEVSSLDIKDSHPHEVIYLGDKVRVKNRDFSPPLYVEAEVVGEDYNLISKESNYLFGQYKEYREEDLRKAFEKRLNDIRDKLNDSISNVNTIVQDTLDTELQYFEKKIIKSNTPPDNAVNDVLWLDTSNPNVPILKRYWNGEWIKSSVDNVEQIGGVTREKALFSELSNTFINLTIQHSKLLNEMYEVINNEYLVDESLKLSLNTNLDKTITTFNNIKTNLDSMTPDTATIGKLVDTQALFLKYREELQALYKVVEQAKISINARFKLLQSQYTDEKFNSAMETVAKTLPNGIWNPDTKILTSDIPNQAKLDSLVNELKLYVDGQDSALETKIGKSVDAKIVDTKNEFTRQFTEVNTKVDNLEIGGRNLIYNEALVTNGTTVTGNTKSLTVGAWAYRILNNSWVVEKLEPNTTYTISYDFTLLYKPTTRPVSYILGRAYLYSPTDASKRVIMADVDQSKYVTMNVGDKFHISSTFTTPHDLGNSSVIFYNTYHQDENGVRDYAKVLFENIMLVKGNKSTDYTQAPEDIDKSINDVTARVETVEGGLTATNKKFETVYSKTETTQLLNSALEPVKSDVSSAKSSITQLSGEITNKVSKSDYSVDQTNVINRLNSADTERQQLSNQIADRVTLTQYSSGIKDAKDYADSAVDGLEIGGKNLIPNSNFSKGLEGWTVMYGSTATKNNGQNAYVFSNTADKFVGVRTPNFDVVAGQTYTLTIEGSRSSNMQQLDYVYMMYDISGVQNQPLSVKSFSATLREFTRVSATFTATTTKVGGNILIAKRPTTLGAEYQLGFYIRNVKLEKGNKATDYTVAPEDTEQKLTTMKTEIIQDGKQIAQTVSNETFNAKAKTLNKVVSQYINDTSTGHQFTYDENGNITNFTVGSSGIKLNAKVIDMNDGDVTIKNGVTTIKDAYIDKLFAKQATIEYLKARDIDLNKATVSGSTEGETTVLSGGKIRSTGSFTRTFPEGSATYESYTESWNGTYRSGLISKSSGGKIQTNITRWLSLNDKSITTQREIHSASPDKRGARFIDFFAEETYTSNVYGQGMHIYSGQDLKIEAGYRLSFQSSNSWYTQFLGGGVEVANDGASLVLKRQSAFNSQSGKGGQYISLQASDGAEHGHLGIISNNRHLSLKSSFGEVHLRGTQAKVLNSEGTSLNSITASDFDLSGVGRIVFEGGDTYLQGQTGVRFTKYKSNEFVNAQAKDFIKASSRELKTNIKTLRGGLETIHSLTPVAYDYKADLENGIIDGDIGFIAEDSPSISMMSGKAISVQKIATWSVLGLKELDNKVEKKFEEYENKIKELEEKLNEQES